MRRRHLLAALAGTGAASVSGCVTTRSLAQGTSDERRVQLRTPDDEPPFTLAELGGSIRAAGARVVRVETAGSLAQLAYEPTELSRDGSVEVVADAFARHVASDQKTSRLGVVVLDGNDHAVADFFVIARWATDLEVGRLSRAEYVARVRETVRPRKAGADDVRP